jgi:hypothetical protein
MLLAQMIGTLGVAPTWDSPDMSGTSDPTLSDDLSSCQPPVVLIVIGRRENLESYFGGIRNEKR